MSKQSKDLPARAAGPTSGGAAVIYALLLCVLGANGLLHKGL